MSKRRAHDAHTGISYYTSFRSFSENYEREAAGLVELGDGTVRQEGVGRDDLVCYIIIIIADVSIDNER